MTSPININLDEVVTPEHIQEAQRIEDDPEMILALVDLIFMGYDSKDDIPS